jgi:hypothetical protein
VPRTTPAGAAGPPLPFPFPEIDIAYAFPPGAPGANAGRANMVKGLEINKIETQTKAEAKAREQILKEDTENSYPIEW